MSSPAFLTQMPLRASADIEPCRVISLSGEYTAAKVASELVQPLGISAEWTVLPPIPDFGLSTLHARGTQKDPVSYFGSGMKAHAVVGTTPIAAAGRVMAMGDGSGRVIPAVPPCWVVGRVGEPAPAGSKVEVYIEPHYVAVGG